MEKPKIPFTDCEKIDIRLGRIDEVEKVSGSKKLLKLRIDIGSGTKQSIAGVGERYGIDDLRGKIVAVVTNLQPRKILGLESEVMLLAAFDESGQLGLLRPDLDMSAGTKVG